MCVSKCSADVHDENLLMRCIHFSSPAHSRAKEQRNNPISFSGSKVQIGPPCQRPVARGCFWSKTPQNDSLLERFPVTCFTFMPTTTRLFFPSFLRDHEDIYIFFTLKKKTETSSEYICIDISGPKIVFNIQWELDRWRTKILLVTLRQSDTKKHARTSTQRRLTAATDPPYVV